MQNTGNKLHVHCQRLAGYVHSLEHYTAEQKPKEKLHELVLSDFQNIQLGQISKVQKTIYGKPPLYNKGEEMTVAYLYYIFLKTDRYLCIYIFFSQTSSLKESRVSDTF